MEPSDIDGPKGGETPWYTSKETVVVHGFSGGETPGEMLARMFVEEGAAFYANSNVGPAVNVWDGTLHLDAIASAFKAAVLAGDV
jgi:hypothetical protein